jgi:hypothetical protein
MRFVALSWSPNWLPLMLRSNVRFRPKEGINVRSILDPLQTSAKCRKFDGCER